MGKSASKLRKRNRTQSLGWSLRYPSTWSLGSKRKMPQLPKMDADGPLHMDIEKWLSVLDLSQYLQIFDAYPGVEALLTFTEADIKALGVKNAAHRASIVSSLFALRTKYEKGYKRGDKSQRYSVAVDTSKMVSTSAKESDILVVSNVTQSKSLCDIKMEADPIGDPVQLRKTLEWELSLDSRDLRSHAWYHGAIPRLRAEEIVRQQGDFLVRDCTSQPGNYVLTCRSGGVPLHFVINKVVIQPDTVYERVQYTFEDEPFDTVSDLITFYVGSGKPITSASRARIQKPCNRMYPLSFYATKYGLNSQISPLASTPGSLRPSPSHSPTRPNARWGEQMPPRLPNKKQRSQSLAPGDSNGRVAPLSLPRSNDDKSNSADGVILDHMTRSMDSSSLLHSKFTTHSLPRGMSQTVKGSNTWTVPRNTSRTFKTVPDCPSTPEIERLHHRSFDHDDCLDGPPPKPSRVPSLSKDLSDLSLCDGNRSLPGHYGSFQRVVPYHTSGSDSGNGSGDSATGDISDSAVHCTTLTHRPHGVIVKNPRFTPPPSTMSSSLSSTTLKAYDYDSGMEDSIPQIPQLVFPSLFNIESYQTLLLPVMENKPLDATALKAIRNLLEENGSRIIANHLSRNDLELIIDENKEQVWMNQVPGISSGLELASLPFGKQMRMDLIERTMCLKLLVSVTILTCTADTERADLLSKWIQIAIDTKTALGNLFGFNSIMMGLCIPQIQRLKTTWHILRQKFTDSAFNFEANLKPILKSMNESRNPQAPNTTIPHLLPFMILQERSMSETLGYSQCTSMDTSCISPWESAPDQGLGTLFSHLEEGRKSSSMLPMFRRNAQIVLGDSKINPFLLDMFRTEFQMKFLWGSRGAPAPPQDRHSKFEDVLNVMSTNCEPPLLEAPPSPVTPLSNYNPAIGTSV